MDVRVDDHPQPTDELLRVCDVAASQLTQFIRDMPRRSDRGRTVTDETAALLALSPTDRPKRAVNLS
jgi:uncharacterized Ntn-hydrolase superfamily protein